MSDLCRYVAALALLALPVLGGEEETEAPHARPVRNPTECDLEAFVRRVYGKVADEALEARRATLREVLATREDMDYLFGEDTELLWPRLSRKIEATITDAPRMAKRTRRKGFIDNILTEVRVIDLRAHERYSEFIALIPESVPAYRVVTHPAGDDRRRAESGPYLHVRGRWLWTPEIDYMPRVLRYLKRKQKVKKAEEESSPEPGAAEGPEPLEESEEPGGEEEDQER